MDAFAPIRTDCPCCRPLVGLALGEIAAAHAAGQTRERGPDGPRP